MVCYDMEYWVFKIVDYLEICEDVDFKWIGCEGVFFGGYYCLCVVVFELCFVMGVIWGVNYDWCDV